MKVNEIKKILKKTKIKKGDTLMIHGDYGITSQIACKNKDKLKILFDEIIKYLGKDGTILIPTFTYSFCKNEYYDVKNTPSDIGLFSENFRKRKNVKRTCHPIFSFSIYGKKYKYFNKAKIDTCFGKDSIFDLFRKVKGKIICLGTKFKFTFIHHIEEMFNVDYRFKKYFDGHIYYNGKKKYLKTEYFVLKKRYPNPNYRKIYDLFELKKIIHKTNFGRFEFVSIHSNFAYKYCQNLLKKDKYFFINK